MAPRTHSNSESESKGKSESKSKSAAQSGSGSSTRAGVKQRLSSAQQQYLKDLAKKHIHNNHRKNTPLANPVDFEQYSDDFLRRYKDRFQLDTPDNLSIQGYLLSSNIGKHTYSYKRNHESMPDARITKQELARGVKEHFDNYTVREAECLPQFIYKVQNKKKKFRMEFKG
ncbi:Transcriptional regulatory protein SAP30 [Kluyveromyces marxianus]|uniref:Transcriptional regulatory protein SAP30 n=2 Tax=Kluyveromyces marxianus TaxID=4911 RepID=W0T4J2_KLUMD|nr:transcriptional regulatory protein SAP30 [Kluyveromyces marxianus DMKU3-1042]QGN14265.1 transcriptional regulatory protein SAP30 [Kluyveromyces marxianus]BAO38527.1 transcriptional regulatory protein SAP30 [Kluyveromyces marxianus DMKU3-1042]BAP70075.1 transcriptional regulatory protein SAP30 [Kluyveromyces marxianus]